MEFEFDKYLNVLAILGCEFCERLAYYGIGSSLTLFLRSDFGYSTEEASTCYTLWSSFATLFALGAGYISDMYWGKKKTILVGALIYAVSLTIVSIITYIFDFASGDLSLSTTEVIFWIALYAMMVGAGGIKSCVGLFGAAQLHGLSGPVGGADDAVDLNDQAEQTADAEAAARQIVESYWNWFYFAINAGALISYTGVSYLCQDVSFAAGWSIPTVAILIAICLFIWRDGKYHEPDIDADQSILHQFAAISWYGMTNQSKKEEILRFNNSNEDPLKSQLLQNGNDDGGDMEEEYHWLDVTKMQHQGPYDDQLVEEVKELYSVFGFLPFMIMYWLVYTASSSLFYSQGCQMDYYFGSFQMPIAVLNDADIIIILILVPLCDRLVYPWLKQGSCCKFGMLRKIGVGYLVLAIAMVTAGLVEIWRKSTNLLDITSTCDSSIYLSSLSVLWQIPQYLLVGVSEVFASIVSLEFFSSQAPESMRAIVYSLNLLMVGIGYLLATLLVVIVDLWTPEWIPTNLNNGHLEYYYFLVAALMILTLFVYIPCAKRYTYKPGTDISNTELSDVDSAEYAPLNEDAVI